MVSNLIQPIFLRMKTSPSAALPTAGRPGKTLFERKPLNVSLLVSPNPASDFVNVELESPVESEFLLLLNDASGRLLRKEMIEKTNHRDASLDLRSLPAGVYTLTVSTNEGVATRKIVKQ